MNYLLVGVIALWGWTKWRKWNRPVTPVEMLPNSRNEAMKELLAKAAAGDRESKETLSILQDEANQGV